MVNITHSVHSRKMRTKHVFFLNLNSKNCFLVTSMQRMLTQIGTPQDSDQLQRQLYVPNFKLMC